MAHFSAPAQLLGQNPGGAICGGATDRRDVFAPKVILSENITFFEVGSSFFTLADAHEYTQVYGYAAPVAAGVLTALSYRTGGRYDADTAHSAVAVVGGDIFAELQKVAAGYRFAERNGTSHYVNGLPENFGGRVCVEYASGESICYDNNQSPVIPAQAGAEIVRILQKYMENQRVKLPDVKDIIAVTYSEERGKDNYTLLRLEGTRLLSEMQFGKGQTCYRHEYTAPETALDSLRETAEKAVLLGWSGLGENDWSIYKDRTEQLIFTMRDGSEIAVKERMRKPQPAGNVIFSVRMALQGWTKTK